MVQGWNPTFYGKGKGKDQKGSWKGKGAWGKGGKGKGTYYMEDDWTAGQSGYSFDIPMFLTSPAPEAASDWQVARSKKPARPATTARMVTPRCGATSTGTRPTCPCHVSKGRYGALSDIGPDLDFDIPMMMMSQVEGDVPPTDAGGGIIIRPPCAEPEHHAGHLQLANRQA